MSWSSYDPPSSTAMAQSHIYPPPLGINGNPYGGGPSISVSSGGVPSYASGVTPPPHSQQPLTYSQQQPLPYAQYPPQLPLALGDTRTLPLDAATGSKRRLEEEFVSYEYLAKRARMNDLVLQKLESIPSVSLYPQRPGERSCEFYMTTGTCKFGLTCKFDHPTWVPAGGIPNWKQIASASVLKLDQPVDVGSLPERPGEPDCAFYMKTGECKFGTTCKFNHPKDRTAGSLEAGDGKEVAPPGTVQGSYGSGSFNASGLPLRSGVADCAFYVKTGSCKFGKSCKFNHPEKTEGSNPAISSFLSSAPGSGVYPAVNGYGLPGESSDLSLSAHPYPLRPGATDCGFYMKSGECKFGATCRFNHPIDRSVKLTAAGLPRREGQPPCPYYLKTGVCSFEATCKFDHPPPGEFAAKAIVEVPKVQAPTIQATPMQAPQIHTPQVQAPQYTWIPS